MNLINIEKESATLRFSSSFYDDGSIIGGLTKYWPYFQNQFNVAWSAGEKPKYFIVTLKPQKGKKFEKEKVLDFCNFVLQREIGRAQAR